MYILLKYLLFSVLILTIHTLVPPRWRDWTSDAIESKKIVCDEVYF